jgi:hypothetical protein
MIISPITNFKGGQVLHGIRPTTNMHFDMPPAFTVSLDVNPTVSCIELPKLVKKDGLERYSLEYKKVRCFTFYCRHKEGEKPTGNGTKEKPWNNFRVALTKLSPLCENLCTEYVQLVVLPESDMVTHGDDEIINDNGESISHKNLIIGSLDGETFCKITLVNDTRQSYPGYVIHSCIFSQCEIYLKNPRSDDYDEFIALRNIHKCILHCKYALIGHVTDSTIYFERRIQGFQTYLHTAEGTIYNSKLEHTKEHTTGYALQVRDIINSTVNLGSFDTEPIVLNLINSKLSGTCTSYNDFHIDHIYNSNIELINTRIKDIRTIIDSSINMKSNRCICIRLSGGCSDEEMIKLGAFAIISNVKIDYTFTPKKEYYGYETPCSFDGDTNYTWGALVFSLRTDYDGLCNPVVVSNCDCNVSIQGHPNDEANIGNIWYCIFPPDCGLPSQCHVIKGIICGIYCWKSL